MLRQCPDCKIEVHPTTPKHSRTLHRTYRWRCERCDSLWLNRETIKTLDNPRNWVLIPTDDGDREIYAVDTAEEISIAEAALAAAGLSSARVWVGDGVDAVASTQTLFASETGPADGDSGVR